MAIVKELYADTFGSHIGKYSERLKLTRKGETLAQAPLMHLETVVVASKGVSISADALAACCERGIPVQFIDSRGEPYAALYAAGLTGTVITRREQLLASLDERGLHLGIAFARGKIENQALLLRYWGRSRKESDPDTAQEFRLCAGEVRDHLAWLDRIDAADVDSARGTILAAEGNAAQKYWAAARLLLPDEYSWPGRSGRGARDQINSLLNYGYGILYQQIQRAIILAGLDPYAGYIHTDRPGKPSLVLDLIEEFRQVAVDRVVFGLAARGYKVPQDEEGRLAEDVRRDFAGKVLKHLETEMRYEGKRHPLRAIIQWQARHIGAYLRGDREAYTPYRMEG